MNSKPTEVKVLIVGNGKTTLKSILGYLESMDILPLTAEAGKDAIDIYRREQPDIVLMRNKLPDIGYAEFSREIRTLDLRDNWTSIIFLTGMSEEED